MRNTTCIICTTPFKARAGKLYCSNACKQKAFNDKKHNNTRAPEAPIKEAIPQRFEFYLSEHQQYLKKYKDSLLSSFLLFCFFRKNFKDTFDPVQFHNYIKTFGGRWWDEFYRYDEENPPPARKQYNEFEARYFGEETTIYFTNPQDK